jgi:hypothetical protein
MHNLHRNVVQRSTILISQIGRFRKKYFLHLYRLNNSWNLKKGAISVIIKHFNTQLYFFAVE